jgi:hypothetical protein
MEYFTERKAIRRRRDQAGLGSRERARLNRIAVFRSFLAACGADPQLSQNQTTEASRRSTREALMTILQALNQVCNDDGSKSPRLFAALQSMNGRELRSACHLIEAALRRGLT